MTYRPDEIRPRAHARRQRSARSRLAGARGATTPPLRIGRIRDCGAMRRGGSTPPRRTGHHPRGTSAAQGTTPRGTEGEPPPLPSHLRYASPRFAPRRWVPPPRNHSEREAAAGGSWTTPTSNHVREGGRACPATWSVSNVGRRTGSRSRLLPTGPHDAPDPVGPRRGGSREAGGMHPEPASPSGRLEPGLRLLHPVRRPSTSVRHLPGGGPQGGGPFSVQNIFRLPPGPGGAPSVPQRKVMRVSIPAPFGEPPREDAPIALLPVTWGPASRRSGPPPR